MDVSLNIKNFADAVAEVASIDNKRIKAVNDLRKSLDAANIINEFICLKECYNQILKWLFLDEFCKGYYTVEDSQLSSRCLKGIMACNDEINSTCSKYVVGKVQSELLQFLFGNKLS